LRVGFGVWGFRDFQGVGFGFWRFGGYRLGFRVWKEDLLHVRPRERLDWFRVQGLGFMVWDIGVWGLGV